MKQLLPILLLLGACETPTVDIPFDNDGDGIMPDEEASLGTDPNSPDSDGDGYGDGEELDLYTDPADASDRPYVGGWPIDSCRHDYPEGGTGVEVGDIAPNFELTDQYGDTVRLHDFCAHAVIIELAAYW